MVTQELLHEIFSYDPETGIFVRNIYRSSKAKKGDIVGSPNNGYLFISINRKTYAAHRLAWLYVYGYYPVKKLDHKNQIRHDNRISNLREATDVENSCNRKIHANNSSGYKGVSYHLETGKWRARCSMNNKDHSLGLYDSPEEAYKAYLTFASKYHGEFFSPV